MPKGFARSPGADWAFFSPSKPSCGSPSGDQPPDFMNKIGALS